MSDGIVYVDTSEVREGALVKLKAAIEELVELVDANERGSSPTTCTSATTAPG
jgi:hypothetical protein